MSYDADQINNRNYLPPTTSHGGIGLNNATGIGRVRAIHENEYKSPLCLNLRAFIDSPQRKSGTLSPLLPPKSSSKSPAESTFRRQFIQTKNQLPDESTNFFNVDISIDGCTDGNENSNYGNEEILSRNKESRKMIKVSNEETVLMAHSDIANLEDNPLVKGRNGNITTEKDVNSFVSSSIENNEMKYPVNNTLSATNGKGTNLKPGKAPESQNHFKLYANSPAKNTRLAQSRKKLEKKDLEYTFKPNALPVSPEQGKRLSIERKSLSKKVIKLTLMTK